MSNENLQSSPLFKREEEYKLLNAKLEAQTAKLVEEAEVMMKEQENFLQQMSSQSNSLGRSLIKDDVAKDTAIVDVISHDTDLLSIAAGGFEYDYSEEDSADELASTSKKESHIFYHVPKNFSKKEPNKSSEKLIKNTETKKQLKSYPKGTSKVKTQHTVENNPQNDLLNAAAEMGTEAQIRFLKAKVRVLQEELNEQTNLNNTITDEYKKCKLELKESKEDYEKIKKNFNQQQLLVQKLRFGFDEEKKKTETQNNHFINLKKELDSLKHEKKQSSTVHNATEVRLNRATEELEKLKTQVQLQKHHDKGLSSQEQKEIEQLKLDNKRLERLRNDSLIVMKKQQKLIGILKQQILHIEAAKLLSFTEEEFVKALDWGSK